MTDTMALKQFRKLAPPGFKPVQAVPLEGEAGKVELVYKHNDGRLWMLRMNLISGALYSVATKNDNPAPRATRPRRYRTTAASASAA